MSARDVIAKAKIDVWGATGEEATDAILSALASSGYRILGPDEIARLTTQIAQLRHAYTHLATERVTHQREFANGLIHPAIAALEEALCSTPQEDK